MLLHIVVFSFFAIVFFAPTRFSFLIWNLFLALIPFDLSLIVCFCSNKLIEVTITGLWIVFLPNSFYMITDYLHLQYMGNNLSPEIQFLNYVILSIGIFLGVILGIISIELIITHFFYNSIIMGCLMIEVFSFLSSLGIYFGHFLRLNSWDLFFNFRYASSIILSSIGDKLTIMVCYLFILHSFILFVTHLGMLVLFQSKKIKAQI